MVYQFKLEANKVDSKLSQGLAWPAIVSYLNRGMMQLLKRRYGGNNNYRATLEQIQKRIDEWQKLIVSHKRLNGTPNEKEKFFEFNLTDAQDYLFLLRATFEVTKGDCRDQICYITRLTQSDDLNNNLDNPNTSSTFEWREINYRLSSDKILAYTDSSFSFSIDTAIIDHLRYPVSLDISGYTHFDGTPSTDIDCELPKFLHDEVVNEAVLLFKASLNHPDLQTSQVVQQIQE